MNKIEKLKAAADAADALDEAVKEFKVDRGRPRLLDDPKLYDLLVELVRGGAWYSVACRACGISYAVFNAWMQRGKKLQEKFSGRVDEIAEDEILYLNFYEAIRKAEALLEIDITRKLVTDRDWKAQVALLERKYPDRWGRTEKHKVEGNLDINVAKLTDKQLADIITGKDINQ